MPFLPLTVKIYMPDLIWSLMGKRISPAPSCNICILSEQINCPEILLTDNTASSPAQSLLNEILTMPPFAGLGYTENVFRCRLIFNSRL